MVIVNLNFYYNTIFYFPTSRLFVSFLVFPFVFSLRGEVLIVCLRKVGLYLVGFDVAHDSIQFIFGDKLNVSKFFVL